MSDKKKFIDLEEVIQSKNPRLAKILPGFVLSYIRKIIHEKEINDFIKVHGDKMDFEFVHTVIRLFNLKIDAIGKENIPAYGGCIFACNHPLGGLDAMALLDEVGKIRKDVKFLVNDVLLNLKNLKTLFIPVNKHGKNSYEMLEAIDKLFASEYGVFIFPAGLVSRKQTGKIIDLEWKKSFVTKARRYKRNIIPVYIDARNTNRFYNIANLRKILGIKVNLEMFYLADEMFYQTNKTIPIIFGKPISHEVFTRAHSDAEWAHKVKEHVYELKSGEKKKMLPTL